jgi:hypothetical protein
VSEPSSRGSTFTTIVDTIVVCQAASCRPSSPAIEPLYAQEAAENGSLPIVNINIAGASTYGTNVRRHGLMLKIAKAFVEESTYPWINYWLRLAGWDSQAAGPSR